MSIHNNNCLCNNFRGKKLPKIRHTCCTRASFLELIYLPFALVNCLGFERLAVLRKQFIMFARNRAKERQAQFHVGAALSAQRGSWDAISTLEVRSIVFSSVVRFSYVLCRVSLAACVAMRRCSEK